MKDKYRESHFRVKADSNERPWLSDEELSLSITHNGYQWTSVALTEAEAVAVIAELRRYLGAKERNKA